MSFLPLVLLPHNRTHYCHYHTTVSSITTIAFSTITNLPTMHATPTMSTGFTSSQFYLPNKIILITPALYLYIKSRKTYYPQFCDIYLNPPLSKTIYTTLTTINRAFTTAITLPSSLLHVPTPPSQQCQLLQPQPS